MAVLFQAAEKERGRLMNYEQANSVKKLAVPVDEVLKGLEWECLGCNGKGTVATKGDKSNTEYWHECFDCRGTGKVKEKWQPKVGEWWVNKLNQKIHCIGNQKELDEIYPSIGVDKNIIPILEWEEIERVLEKAGYWIKVSSYDGCYLGKIEGVVNKAFIHIKVNKIQEAVMKAVIELGKNDEHKE